MTKVNKEKVMSLDTIDEPIQENLEESKTKKVVIIPFMKNNLRNTEIGKSQAERQTKSNSKNTGKSKCKKKGNTVAEKVVNTPST